MPGWMMNSDTSTEAPGFQPWQLFTLAGLVGATLAVFFAQGQPPAVVILISLVALSAAAVGVAALHVVRPLAWTSTPDRPASVGGRTRAALEREKTLALRSIKELEFDRAMGKLSDRDFNEMSQRLRVRAARLLRQLDAGSDYRAAIERDLALRAESRSAGPAEGNPHDSVAAAANPCTDCGSLNDGDARYCKACGTSLAGRQ